MHSRNEKTQEDITFSPPELRHIAAALQREGEHCKPCLETMTRIDTWLEDHGYKKKTPKC